MGGCGWGVVRGCPSHTCTCMRTHAHACTRMYTHACARAYDIIGNSHGISPMGAAICMKLSCLPRMCLCACVHACMCTCVCGAPPKQPPPPYTHPPIPRAAGSPKHQNSISFELIEIIRFCLKILYL